MVQSEAIARFLDQVALACVELATQLREEAGQRHIAEAAGGYEAKTSTATSIRLGVRERDVLRLFARIPAGQALNAKEVAEGIGGYDQANIYFPLRTLTSKHLLLELKDAVPTRWRLADANSSRPAGETSRHATRE